MRGETIRGHRHETGNGLAARSPILRRAEPSRGNGASVHGAYRRLLQDVAGARAAATLQPGVERMLSEGMSRRRYLDFLEQLYHIVWHFCPTMAAAAARCNDDSGVLRYALYEKIQEEKGHESWVLDDVAAIGGDPDKVAASRPSVPVRAMIGHNYSVVERQSPWAVLGMTHVLEEISANYSGRVAAAIAKRLEISEGPGFRFLTSHGLLDVDHMKSVMELVEQVPTELDLKAIVEAVEVNYALFGALFREV